MTADRQYGLVRPGEGVDVDKIDLAPVLDGLRTGTYVLDDEAQQSIHDALLDPGTSKGTAKAALNDPANKSFKVAFTSLIAEQVWPSYSALATDDDPGIYTLGFDGDRAKLERKTAESTAGLPLYALAEEIAASNQAMMTFSTCGLFSGGKIPEICGDAEKDAMYFNAFREQTELQLGRTTHYFETIPNRLDAPSRFVASGLQSIRTHVFGIPNLLDGVSANEGIALTPDQHRRGVGVTYNRGIMPYFYPTGPLMLSINAEFADPKTQRLLPEHWVSNRNPDQFFVFPRPEIVRRGNEAAAQRDDLPAQTACPVVHSRVANPEAPDKAVPFTRALGQVVFWQLDNLYYPERRRMLAEV